MASEFNLNNFRIDQLGYIYKDIRKQAKFLEQKFNIPKFVFIENKDKKYYYRGKETIISTEIGLSRIFNTQIELIQLIEGECIFTEFLNAGKEGLHHFGVFVTNLKKIVNHYKEMGFEVVHEGIAAGRQKVAYLDTYDILGVYVEFQESIRRKRKKNRK
ncbi:MAG: VOC family protein [Promethearchaeota archaeon]